MWLIAALYIIVAIWLAIYGANSLWLLWRYWRTRHDRYQPPPVTDWPLVTVQLPIYNEIHVVERLLKAVTSLDYPRDRLEIQVLDDSTDETAITLQAAVERYRQQGFDIHLLHRVDRRGYKAGALSEGLARARGELIAVFDADFVPPAGWLKATVPYLVHDPGLGFVQTRWGHINATYSPLTMAQSIILDAHFGVEHPARQRSGYFINFNGTAGIWRRSCIEEAGGWQAATLTEDLDLSYRAQLAGWRPLYLPDVVAPAEIPPQIEAFKRQQFRWAKGSAQCLRRLAAEVWQSPRPLAARLQGLIHLSGYVSHPLMLVMLLLSLPMILLQWQAPVPLAFLSLASLGPPLIFGASQVILYRPRQDGLDWWARLLHVPLVLLLGTGIALNNARAVIEGLIGRPSEFRRTPKFRVESRQDRWVQGRYALPLSASTLLDLLLSLYAAATLAAAWAHGLYWAIPFLSLYCGGFLLVAATSLWQSRQRRARRQHRPAPSLAPTAGAPPMR